MYFSTEVNGFFAKRWLVLHIDTFLLCSRLLLLSSLEPALKVGGKAIILLSEVKIMRL